MGRTCLGGVVVPVHTASHTLLAAATASALPDSNTVTAFSDDDRNRVTLWPSNPPTALTSLNNPCRASLAHVDASDSTSRYSPATMY